MEYKVACKFGRYWQMTLQCSCSGGSRISQKGTPTQKTGAPTYYLARKMHENERNWKVGRGGGVVVAHAFLTSSLDLY